MRRLLALLVISIVFGGSAGHLQAQVIRLYDILQRPVGVSYRVMDAGPWEIIYQDGNRAQALEVLHTLQTTFAATDSLIGDGSPPRLSVVLNNFNDRANGYVSTQPFKSEIEAAAIMGRGLSLRHESWTQVVTAHELVHAVQADARWKTGMNRLIWPFSPDFARSLNMSVPSGWAEGLAVYRESAITPGAGRLNHPFFNMQQRAGMDRGNGWSLSQMLEEPDYTRPFNRFYLGGSLFTRYIMERWGQETVHSVARWQHRIPILGFGGVLALATGEWPWEVRRDMQVWYDSTYGHADPAPPTRFWRTGRNGLVQRTPKWLDDTRLVVFSFAYNLPSGFRTFTWPSTDASTWSIQGMTEDVRYARTPSGDLLFSRYIPHPVSNITSYARGYVLRQGKRQAEPLASETHMLNPVQLRDGRTWYVRQRGPWSDIMELRDGEDAAVVSYPEMRIASITASPVSDSVAFVANVRGHQALFLRMPSGSVQPWIGFQDASVYDASWNASGTHVAFTADVGGTMQAWVLDVGTEKLYRVTHDPYAAMEPDISPDGTRIAYIIYRDQRFDLVVEPLVLTDALEQSRDKANHTWLLDWEASGAQPDARGPRRFATDADSIAWSQEDRPYRPWSRLLPRMVFPTAYLDESRSAAGDARLGLGVGLGVQGNDPLQTVSWWGEGIIQKGRPWGEIGVLYGGWDLIPVVEWGRRPETVTALVQTGPTTTVARRAIRDRTRFRAGVTLPRILRDNVTRSSFFATLSLSWRKDQFLDDNLDKITDSFSRWAFTPSIQYTWKLHQTARGGLARTGTRLVWVGEFDLEAEKFSKRRGWIARADQYVPLLSRFNTGIRLSTGFLHQNVGGVFSLDGVRPRGWERAFVQSGDFVMLGAEVRQPVLFVDDGFQIVPLFLRSAYAFGFTERLHNARDFRDDLASVGLGFGIEFRMGHSINLDLRWRWSYLLDAGTWVRDVSLIDQLP